jgi:hypothetical protein
VPCATVREMAAPEAIQLDPRAIDEIADRLCDAAAKDSIAHIPGTAAWRDAKEGAQRLGIDREWVYGLAPNPASPTRSTRSSPSETPELGGKAEARMQILHTTCRVCLLGYRPRTGRGKIAS